MSNLDGINFYGDITVEDRIAQNITSFFKYGLLEIGAFYTIGIDSLNYLGENVSVLSPLSGRGITNYTLYRGLKTDWVWERDLTLKYAGGTQPQQISGILVNGTFYATGTNVNGGSYYIDYSRGGIIFSSPLTSTDIVKVARTERGVNIYPTDGPEFRSIMYNWRSNHGPSGRTDLEFKSYLPAVFLGVRGIRTIKGVELGGRAKTISANLEFDIIAANSNEAKKLSDIIHSMETKSIRMYDINNISYPLNSRGELVNPSAVYPNYAANDANLWTHGRFQENCRIVSQTDTKIPIYHRKVNIGIELDVRPF